MGRHGATHARSLRGAGQQFGARLGAGLGQEFVRLGPAFDGARFDTPWPVADFVRGEVLQMNGDQLDRRGLCA